MRQTILTLALLLLASVASAQDVINPSQVEFGLSIDHDMITTYQVDLVDSTGAVEATIPLGKPAGVFGDTVTVSINVQPISFGTYTGVFRAVFDAANQSVDVPATNDAIRQPGGPSNPRFAELFSATIIIG